MTAPATAARPADYPGTCFPPGAAGKPCRLQPNDTGITASHDGAPLVHLHYRDLPLSRSGDNRRYITFTELPDADGRFHTLVTPQKEILDHIAEQYPSRHFHEQLAKLRQANRRVTGPKLLGLLFALGLLILLGLGLRALWHGAIDLAIEQLPTGIEIELGRTQAQRILNETDVCTDEALNAAMDEIGQRLTLGLGGTPYQWRVRVLDSPDINAFALPGGYVFVNRALIAATDDGHELAGVLAHEFQHVVERHGIRNAVANVSLTLVLFALLGDADALQAMVLNNLASLASMSFSRSQETAADLGAMHTLYRAELDPMGLVRFMDKLSAQGGAALPSILSTHPASNQRKGLLQAHVDAHGLPSVRPLRADWSAVKTRCSPARIADPASIGDDASAP